MSDLTRAQRGLAAAGLHFSLSRLEEWVADTAADHAARSRARIQMLIGQQAQETTMVDLLENLADRSRSAGITLIGGRRFAGVIKALGEDFMILSDFEAGEVFIPYASLAVVLPGPEPAELPPERPFSLSLCFADALADLAAERAGIVAEVAGSVMRGELRSAGQDVITIRPDSGVRTPLYVSMAAIASLVVVRR